MGRKCGWLAIVWLMACGRDPGTDAVSQAVVYDGDSRREVYQLGNPAYSALARGAIVALVPSDSLNAQDPTDVTILGDRLRESWGLCPGERYGEQPSAASCSGTLIDRDLLLTAGHCVPTQDQCEDLRYVFNFFYEGEGELATVDEARDVYGCKELLVSFNDGNADYAVVQLDRPVAPEHSPAPVRSPDIELQDDDRVVLMGFPSGIPLKVDPLGRVMDARVHGSYFEASVDGFGGNSGSGVFDTGGQVVGILVRGPSPDYASAGPCNVVRELSSSGSLGIESTHVARAIEPLCALGSRGRLCGDEDGWCWTCSADDQCPEGMACRAAEEDPTRTWCAPACEADADCWDDHRCGADGYCEPGLVARCDDGQVHTTTACGRSLEARSCDDGQVCRDGECVAGAQGSSCADPVVLEPSSQRIQVLIDGSFGNSLEGLCGGSGANVIYRFQLERLTRFAAEASGADTLLYLRTRCPDFGTELACNDNSRDVGNGGSRIARELVPGTYFLVLDTHGPGPTGVELATTFEELGEPPPPEPPSDAGSDPRPSRDAGDHRAEADAGIPEGTPPDGGGGCAAAGHGGGSSLLFLCLLGWLWFRRGLGGAGGGRRRARPRAPRTEPVRQRV